MNKVKVSVEIEICTKKLFTTDEDLESHEIANSAALAFVNRIKNLAEESSRKTAVISSGYEYTISQKIH